MAGKKKARRQVMTKLNDHDVLQCQHIGSMSNGNGQGKQSPCPTAKQHDRFAVYSIDNDTAYDSEKKIRNLRRQTAPLPLPVHCRCIAGTAVSVQAYRPMCRK
ncbi:hypothetical protein X546_22410 [Brevibacillus borstelensis cifa_chp40]|nr:hypothetical protein X546_22410 [Brevibacillus borstelensis cifa_chp40]